MVWRRGLFRRKQAWAGVWGRMAARHWGGCKFVVTLAHHIAEPSARTTHIVFCQRRKSL